MATYCASCSEEIPDGLEECFKCRSSKNVSSLVSTLLPLPPPIHPLDARLTMAGLPPKLSTGITLVQETYKAGKCGVSAVVTIPAVDVEIMNEMGALVIISHQMASMMMDSLRTDSGETSALITKGDDRILPVINKMAEYVLLLHRMADRMNQFQGFLDSTRQLMRAMRLLATDVQGEIENWNLTRNWILSGELKGVIRQCRVLATDLQGEIESRRGPQG